MSRAFLIVTILCAACGGGTEPGGDDAPGDDAAGDDAATDAAVDPADPPCDPSAGGCPWIEAYEMEVVGKLAGAQPIAPGVTLLHRASQAERDAARGYLIAELTRLGYTVERYAYGTTGADVLATLPETEPNPGGLVVIGAHFDGVTAGPAAADDATGVAVVLAAARYYRTVATRTHPVVFALFDQEELGLFGSGHYADRLVADHTAVTAVHSFDMISYDGDGDHAIELWSPSPAIAAAYQAAGQAAGIPIESVTFASSDHQSFLDRGFAATGVGEEFVSGDHTANYHRATDTYDKVDFTYLARSTRLALTVLATTTAAP